MKTHAEDGTFGATTTLCSPFGRRSDTLPAAMAELLSMFAELLVFLVGGPLAFWFSAHAYFKGRLGSNANYRRAQVEALRQPQVTRIYVRALKGGLRFLDLIMGKLDLRQVPRAFGVCLFLATTYSFMFLLISWGLHSGTGQIGPTELLPDWPQLWRLLMTVAVIFYILTVYYIAWRIDGWAVDKASPIPQFLVVAGAGALAFALAGAGAGAGAGFVAVVVAGAFALAFAGVIARSRAREGAGAGAGAVVVAGAVSALGAVTAAVVVAVFIAGRPNVSSVVLFWAILPVGNAIWDWPSWWVSRGLGGHLLAVVEDRGLGARRKLAIAIVHVAVDFVLAVAFLVLLAATLPRLVEWWNHWVAVATDIGHVPLPLDGYLCQAALDPWGDGAWVMLMLLSTLIPTALHALMALTSPLAFWALKWQGAPRIADQLVLIPAEHVAGKSARHDAVIDNAATHLTRAWLGVTIAVCVLLVGGWFLLHAGDTPAWLDQGTAWLRWFLLRVALRDGAAASACLS